MEDVGKEEAGGKVRDTLAMGAHPPAAGPEAAGGGPGEAARRGHFTCWRMKVFIAATRGTKD